VKRRENLSRRIRKFKMVQTRQALSMLDSRACNPRLLVALDTLLERFDKELKSRDLKPSSLRDQLRECNDDRCKKRWESRGRRDDNDKDERKVMDLQLLPTDLSIRQLRNELRIEEEKLNAEEELEEARVEVELLKNLD